MRTAKVKSFTLSEMLVVMIITVIVVGIAFSVLSLVQKQIRTIQKNYQKTTELSLLEQRLWQDFNQHNSIIYKNNQIVLASDNDTVSYSFKEDFTLRNTDTLQVKVAVSKTFYRGTEVKTGIIDAMSLSGNREVPDYSIFVSSQEDATNSVNNAL